jgi:RNA polymerase sigma-70 factor (ECF subfamily)
VKSDIDYNQTEAPLINQASRGSEEAFSELVRMHSRLIYSTSLGLLKNHADAEDNLQDVLCKAYKNIHRFQGRSRFATWLFRITINEALMKIRKGNCANRAGQTDPTAEPGQEDLALTIRDKCADPERQCIASDLASKAFRRVPPLLKQTFILYQGEGWTHRELAGAMGIAVATVKSRIFRTRAHVQRHLRALS